MMAEGQTRMAAVKAVTAPLGFYVLALLIVETTIGLVLIKSDLDAKDKFYGLLLAVGMFVLAVLMVAVLVCFKAQNLTFDRDAPLIDSGKASYGSDAKEIQAAKFESESSKPMKKNEEV